MNQTVVRRDYDRINKMTVFVVQNTDRNRLSVARDYICREVADMRLLLANRVKVTEIDGREFRIGVPDEVRTIPGAFDWIANDLVRKIADKLV